MGKTKGSHESEETTTNARMWKLLKGDTKSKNHAQRKIIHPINSGGHIMALHLGETIILPRQLAAGIFTPDNHRYDQTRNGQTDESGGNEHVLKTIPFHPRSDGKGNTNADGVADKDDTRECVAGNLNPISVSNSKQILYSGDIKRTSR
jgi:hypothetical protein